MQSACLFDDGGENFSSGELFQDFYFLSTNLIYRQYSKLSSEKE
jgi:hypothetical protein